MGYKGLMRSAVASSNRAARESAQRKRKEEREVERLRKKMEAVERRRLKVFDELKNLRAKGKIDDSTYERLLEERGGVVTTDLIVFGKIPAVNLLKRYLCGKIDEKEFNAILEDVIPLDARTEKNDIAMEYSQRLASAGNFKELCNDDQVNCSKCGKEKKFLSFIKMYNGLSLCFGCRGELKSIIKCSGYRGAYYNTGPHTIDFEDLEAPRLEVSVQSEHFLK